MLGEGNSFSLSSGISFIVGGGIGCPDPDDIWAYDPLANRWSLTSVDGLGRFGCVTFALGSSGYVGLGGISGVQAVCNPGSCLRCATCDCLCLSKDLWRFRDGAWEKTPFIFPELIDAVSFVIGENAYFGTGHGVEGCLSMLQPLLTNKFWRFNPFSGISMVDPFPGYPCFKGSAFSKGNKGYVGWGDYSIKDGYETDYRFYEFDQSRPTGTQWVQFQDIPPAIRSVLSPHVMTLGSRVFLLGLNSVNSSNYDTWEFDPAKTDPWRKVAPLSAKGQPIVISEANVVNTLGYILLDRGEDNFWMYVPEL